MQAEQLLAEIDAQSGSEFLTSILQDVDPLGATHIASLDSLFSPSSLPQDLRQDETVDHAGILSRFATTELQGPPKSGKTSLLAFLILTFLLPASFDAVYTRAARPSASMSAAGDDSRNAAALERKTLRVHAGGRGPRRGVLVFDNDGRFPVTKLRRMMRLHVHNRLAEARRRTDVFDRTGTLPWSPPDEESLERLMDAWMATLLIWRPQDQTAFAAAVQQAPAAVQGSPNISDVGLIVVDSISAFHWEGKLRAGTTAAVRSGDPYAGLASALRHLKDLQEATAAPLLLSNWAITEGDKDASAAPSRQAGGGARAPSLSGPLPGGRWWHQHLASPPYAPFGTAGAGSSENAGLTIDHHITLAPTQPQPFPAGTGERAARADIARAASLERMLVKGWVRSREGGSVVGGARVAAGSTSLRGTFTFRIGDEALDVTL